MTDAQQTALLYELEAAHADLGGVRRLLAESGLAGFGHAARQSRHSFENTPRPHPIHLLASE